MKKTFIKISVLSSILFMFSCGGDTTESAKEEVVEAAAVDESCTYSYSAENTQVSWVAFKTTKKIGVGGDFLNFTIEGTNETSTPLEVVKGASISIPVSSVETKDEGRNAKIVEFFFGAFTDTETLTGTVKEVSEDGSGILTLKMNGIENDVPVQVAVEGAKINITTTIDLNNWDGQAAIDMLNEKCEGKHTGDDGITKLWPEVEINISTELLKDCK
jgi:hypothetical protein